MVPKHQLIIPSTLLALATNIQSHKDTYAHATDIWAIFSKWLKNDSKYKAFLWKWFLFSWKSLQCWPCFERDLFNFWNKQATDIFNLQIKYHKIPKISPGAYIFQRPLLEGLIFRGAYIWRGLSTEGNLHFKIDRACLIVGSKFTIFALFYFVFEGNYPSTSPWGAYIWRGDLTEAFLGYRFGGLIHGGAYLRNFMVLCARSRFEFSFQTLWSIVTFSRQVVYSLSFTYHHEFNIFVSYVKCSPLCQICCFIVTVSGL